jgi:hypothetical protein
VPAIGDEVELDVVEFPGDKLVARSIRGRSGVKRATDAGQPLRAGIRGITSVSVTPAAAPGPPRPSAPAAAAAPRDKPTTLGGVTRHAREDIDAQLEALRVHAWELDARTGAVTAKSDALRAEAARKRRDLELEIARIERSTEQQIEELVRSAEQERAEAIRLRTRTEALEGAATELVIRAATGHTAAEAARVMEEVERRTQALAAVGAARDQAVRKAGDEPVRKYDDARRKSRSAPDPDDREAFGLLERQRRETVRDYAVALDSAEGWQPLVVPIWQIGAGGESNASAILAPLSADALEAEGVTWRLASALFEGVERARVDHSHGGTEPVVELGSVAGCLAIRIDGLDTELLPLFLEEAQDARPSLGRLAVTLRWEEVPDLRLPIEAAVDEVTSLDDGTLVAAGPATGGTTREVAARLGLDLEELLAVLVERGLPFPDDTLDAGTEDSLRALLGIEGPQEERPEPAPAAAPATSAPPVPLELQIAARVLGKLLRAHVIGGKHTAIQNVYGHHFSDAHKDVAKDVTERLISIGILREKISVGARHVSINPRRLDHTRALAEQRCEDPVVVRALLQT